MGIYWTKAVSVVATRARGCDYREAVDLSCATPGENNQGNPVVL